jgi:hypothetical protein
MHDVQFSSPDPEQVLHISEHFLHFSSSMWKPDKHFEQVNSMHFMQGFEHSQSWVLLG